MPFCKRNGRISFNKANRYSRRCLLRMDRRLNGSYAKNERNVLNFDQWSINSTVWIIPAITASAGKKADLPNGALCLQKARTFIKAGFTALTS